jgi:hypothetical protein
MPTIVPLGWLADVAAGDTRVGKQALKTGKLREQLLGALDNHLLRDLVFRNHTGGRGYVNVESGIVFHEWLGYSEILHVLGLSLLKDPSFALNAAHNRVSSINP